LTFPSNLHRESFRHRGSRRIILGEFNVFEFIHLQSIKFYCCPIKSYSSVIKSYSFISNDIEGSTTITSTSQEVTLLDSTITSTSQEVTLLDSTITSTSQEVTLLDSTIAFHLSICPEPSPFSKIDQLRVTRVVTVLSILSSQVTRLVTICQVVHVLSCMSGEQSIEYLINLFQEEASFFSSSSNKSSS
jgi:hypothetical protein